MNPGDEQGEAVMECLKNWVKNPGIALAILLSVAGLGTLTVAFVAVGVRNATEVRCADQLEKALITLKVETIKATIGLPASLEDVYGSNDVIYCLGAMVMEDGSSRALSCRAGENMAVDGRLITYPNDDGEISFVLESGKFYRLLSDEGTLSIEPWALPNTLAGD